MGSVWDWLMDMYVIRVASNCMLYVGVGLQFVASHAQLSIRLRVRQTQPYHPCSEPPTHPL